MMKELWNVFIIEMDIEKIVMIITSIKNASNRKRIIGIRILTNEMILLNFCIIT